jgi:hypothetical protein
MKRPVIVCTMALLAAAGVAQVPMHWDYPATPQMVAPLPKPRDAVDNANASSVAKPTAQAAKDRFSIAKVGTPTAPPVSAPSTAGPTEGANTAAPRNPDVTGQIAGPASQATAGPPPATDRQKLTQGATGLPPPPRNSDVPPPRSDARASPAVQPATAVARVQAPIEVPLVAPSNTAPRGAAPAPKGPAVAQKSAARPPVSQKTSKSQRLEPRASPPQIFAAQPPPRRSPPARVVSRPKPVLVRLASPSPLAYAYAPAPRLSPAARRAPAPRLQ